MGLIKVEVQGSFHDHPGDITHMEVFQAESGGHARAVAKAIEFLTTVVMPNAIELDHWLHEQGRLPFDRFGLQKAFGVGPNHDHDDPRDVHED